LSGAEVIRSVTKIWPENTWQFDEPMSDDYFCDFVHVDERGQATYSNWLVKQIQALQPYSA
jgi:hypothetical protein